MAMVRSNYRKQGFTYQVNWAWANVSIAANAASGVFSISTEAYFSGIQLACSFMRWWPCKLADENHPIWLSYLTMSAAGVIYGVAYHASSDAGTASNAAFVTAKNESMYGIIEIPIVSI